MVILGIFIVILLLLGYYAIKQDLEQSNKDWETLHDLEKRVNEITTIEELNVFHKEFREKSKNIHNEYISSRLTFIDGYCRGLYKVFKINK